MAKGQQYGVTGSFPYVPNPASAQAVAVRFDKPYVYKPKGPIAPQQQGPATHTAQRFALGQTMQSPSPSTYLNQNHYAAGRAYQNSGMYSVQRFEPMGSSASQTGSAAPQKHQYAGVPNAPQPAVTPAQTWQPHSPASYQKPSPVQQSRPNWQVHSSVYQKYPFFQVNHNRYVVLFQAGALQCANLFVRDAVKYRTPYSPWGGFTNGYEGDLRAHLMSHQNDLLRRPTFSSMSPGLNGSPLAVPRSHHTQQFARPLEPSRPLPSPQTPNPNGHSNGQNGFNSLQPNVQQQPSAGPYNGSVQNHQPMTHQPTQVPKPKPAPTPKSYKVGMPAAIGPVLQSMKY